MLYFFFSNKCHCKFGVFLKGQRAILYVVSADASILYMFSRRLLFFFVLNHDLFVYRADSLPSYKTLVKRTTN